jgi:tetratricopeptide (TPR) repeat protein
MSSKQGRHQRRGLAVERRPRRRGRFVIAIVVLAAGAITYFTVGPSGIQGLIAPIEPPAIPELELQEVEAPVVRALTEARAAVVANPQSAEHWGRFGQVCDIHGFLTEAVVCYEFAMNAAPRDARWPYLLGFVYELRDEPASKSIALYARTLERRPDYWPAMVRRGDASMRVQDFAAAHADFARAATFVPSDPAVLRRLGQAQLELGQIEDAIATLSKAAQLNANDQSTHAALAKAYSSAGDSVRAEQASQQAAAAKPNSELSDPIREQVVALGVSSTIVLMRADQFMRNGAYDRARENLQLALQVRPNDAAVHARMGRACAALGRPDEAIQHLKRAIEIDPTHAASYVRLGSLMNDMGHTDPAVQHFTRAVELEPENGASHALLAIALTRAGHLDEALTHFERSHELSPASDVVEFNWGNAFMRKGEVSSAAEHYSRAIALNLNYADAHFNYGIALEQLGRIDDAMRAYEMAVRINPQHRAAEHLARLTSRN